MKKKPEIERTWKGRTLRGEPDAVQHAIDALTLEDARQRATEERWGSDKRVAMTRLCRSFPTLHDAIGIEPWAAMQFLRWLTTSGAVTGSSRHAGKFVLLVWNSSDDWQAIARIPSSEGGLGLIDVDLSPFNVAHALATWDIDHADAFKSWVELPFWP